jgi:gluconolactonase
MRPLLAFSLTLTFTLTLRAADEPSPVAAGAKLEKLATGFKFTEGPAPDADGNVYVTDQPNDKILKWGTDGKLTTFMEGCGRSNGLCFDKDGTLWACADEKNELWKINVKTKEKTVVVKDHAGKLLNGPNDVWVRPDGGAYFSDPFYKRPYWKRGATEQDKQAVYYVSPDGKLSRVDGNLKQPNGVIGTADGKTLYVADIGDRKTYRYDIEADAVTVYDKAGKKVATIDVPEGATNVCFGGKDMQTLFITAGTSLYSIPMRTKGVVRQ